MVQMEQPQHDMADPESVISVSGRNFQVDALDQNTTHHLNRELSWLAFNARVLASARDARVPLLERVKFLAIYGSNLDEFFQVRVAGLRDQFEGGVRRRTPDGRTPEEQLVEIRRAVVRLENDRQQIFTNELLPQLRLQGITILRYAELSEADQKIADAYFEDQVFPILTPLAVDPGHPFPYISDLSLNLGVRVRRSGDDRARFARIKIPDTVHRLVPLSTPGSFLRVEDLLVANLDQLFPGLTVVEHLVFRVTRNADLNYRDEEADDLLELVEMELRRRRLGAAVRLEIAASSGNAIRALLTRELELEDTDVFVESSFLAMVDLFEMLKLDRPELQYPDFSPVVPYRVSERSGEDVDLFEELREQDLFVHHPYESFSATTQEFIRRAASDPKVVAIKMTLYRTSSDSPIIRALVRAAEAGKQVAVLIELKARFDERANIEWAKALEQAGVHVTYGLAGLKIHAKITMVVRREAGKMVRYCHFGTGNYNQGTARIYGDFGLLTASEQLGDQVAVLFNTLTGYGDGVVYPNLLVAPESLRKGLEDLIRQEMEAPNGRIILKMNSLIDRKMIERLYEASQAGVQIECIVRGVCGLRPGVPGLSENIRVRSIIGRYLEHARLYWFANGRGPDKPSIYMGSADLMSRNLDHRVEALVLIEDETAVAHLNDIVELNLTDGLQTWLLQSDGSWHRDSSDGRPDLHAAFEAEALGRRSPGTGV
jgi:polyphosphate kinase